MPTNYVALGPNRFIAVPPHINWDMIIPHDNNLQFEMVNPNVHWGMLDDMNE